MPKKTNLGVIKHKTTKKKTRQGYGRNTKKSKLKKYRGQGGPKRSSKK